MLVGYLAEVTVTTPEKQIGLLQYIGLGIEERLTCR